MWRLGSITATGYSSNLSYSESRYAISVSQPTTVQQHPHAVSRHKGAVSHHRDAVSHQTGAIRQSPRGAYSFQRAARVGVIATAASFACGSATDSIAFGHSLMSCASLCNPHKRWAVLVAMPRIASHCALTLTSADEPRELV